MGSFDRQPTLDELLLHGRWVRGLARELVRDEHTAEDVVQATWMAALRRPPADGTNLRGWLATVVRNFARELARSEEGRQRRERAAARPEATPSATDAEERARVQRDLVDLLLRLEEPYRSVLLLRYFEGLPPRKVAARLGIPVATVRSRHARGLERLRARLIREHGDRDTWLGAFGLLAIPHAQGISPGMHAGGWLLSKKIIVTCATLVLGLLTFVWMHRGASDATRSGVRDARSTSLTGSSRPSTGNAPGIETPSKEPDRQSIAPETAGLHVLHGRVLDAATEAPVAHAELSLYAPKRVRRGDISADSLALMQVEPDGSLLSRAHPAMASNPDDLQLAGIEPIDVLDVPEERDIPLARAMSAADGGFTLSSPSAEGFLVVRAAGYGDRRVAWRRAPIETPSSAREVLIARSHVLRGRVIDDEGTPVARRMRFVVYGHVKAVFVSERDTDLPDLQDDSWLMETSDDGTFAWDVAAQMIDVSSAEPDLVVLEFGPLATGGRGCRPEPWISPGKEAGDVAIVVHGVCVLAVSDAATGAPIERFFLKCSEHGGFHGYGQRWNGWFESPDGEKCLAMSNGDARSSWVHGHVKTECSVWAPGHVQKDVTVDDPWRPQRVEVKLERGAAARIAGCVTRSGSWAPNTPVALYSIPDVKRWYWSGAVNDTHWMPFGGARTDSAGRFDLEVLPGAYLASIGEPKERVLLSCTAPVSDLTVDLAQHAELLVRVCSLSGASVGKCKLDLRRPDGGRLEADTDARGEARFPDVCPGTHVLRASRVSPKTDDGADVTRELDVHAGDDNVVDVTLPADRPRFAKLFVEGAKDASGWRARKSGWPDSTYVDVEPAGRIPIDLRSTSQITVKSNSHQMRLISVPDAAPDGYEIHVRADGPGYEGGLTSSAADARVAGITVVAWEDGVSFDGQTRCVAVTDAHGNFHLDGMREVKYRLQFLRSDSASSVDFSGMTVVPRHAPAVPQTRLSIELPASRGEGLEGIDVTSVTGHVSNAGKDVKGFLLRFSAVIDRPEYELVVERSAFVTAGGDYSITLPRAAQYSTSFWSPATKTGSAAIEWNATGARNEAHDFSWP